jgi:hypothetical protein
MSPSLAAAISSFIGFGACFETCGHLTSGGGGPTTTANTISVIVGVAITAGVYALFARMGNFSDTANAAPPNPARSTLPPGGGYPTVDSPVVDGPSPNPVPARTGGWRPPATALLTTCALCGAIGAFICGFFMAEGGDSGVAAVGVDYWTTFLGNGLIGFVLGAIIGLVPAIPTAVLVWIVGRTARGPRAT